MAEGSVATAIMVRLCDDCAWAFLGVPLTGGTSGMIIVFFPSASAHAVSARDTPLAQILR